LVVDFLPICAIDSISHAELDCFNTHGTYFYSLDVTHAVQRYGELLWVQASACPEEIGVSIDDG
jgi:hypothetical protein